MSFLADPKFFNYLILVLYALNAGRWAFSISTEDLPPRDAQRGRVQRAAGL